MLLLFVIITTLFITGALYNRIEFFHVFGDMILWVCRRLLFVICFSFIIGVMFVLI